MDWIKKNYALFSLALFAVLLLAGGGLLIWNALNFDQKFESIRVAVAPNNKLPSVDQAIIEQAKTAMKSPGLWSQKEASGLLFVSRKYLVKDGALVNPLDKNGIMLHPPVPNQWFEEHKLDILDNDIFSQDPDKDGFSNYDEWVGSEVAAPGTKSTDPNDPKSHPAYLTKLKLKRFIKKPFRLLFNAYDGDPSKLNEMSFQINTVDVRQPTQFRKLNEVIVGTKFKAVGFHPKKFTDANGVEKDISELVLENIENNDQVTLILEKVVDSPDSYALFKYGWDSSEMVVKKEKTFSIKPDIDVQYKLIDIQEGEALIEEIKTGSKLKIPKITE